MTDTIFKHVLYSLVLILTIFKVDAYEANTAQEQLDIDIYLMHRHSPKGTFEHRLFASRAMFPYLHENQILFKVDDIINRQLPQRKQTKEIAVDAAFRLYDLVLFGKQSRSSIIKKFSNFVIDDKNWGFIDSYRDDADNGVLAMIAHGVDIATTVLTQHASPEQKKLLKEKIHHAQKELQQTTDTNYKEHLEIALEIIKRNFLYEKWREEIIDTVPNIHEITKAEEKIDRSGYKLPVGHGYEGGFYFPGTNEGKSAYKKLSQSFFLSNGYYTDRSEPGYFYSVKWSNVDWKANDFATGLFSDESQMDDFFDIMSSICSRDSSQKIDHIYTNLYKHFNNISFILSKGAIIEQYDRSKKFNYFNTVIHPIFSFNYVKDRFFDEEYKQYYSRKYIDLYSVLNADYRKHNQTDGKFIPLSYSDDKLSYVLKFINDHNGGSLVINRLTLTDKEKDEFHEYLRDIAFNSSPEFVEKEYFYFQQGQSELDKATVSHEPNFLDIIDDNSENNLNSLHYFFKTADHRLSSFWIKSKRLTINAKHITNTVQAPRSLNTPEIDFYIETVEKYSIKELIRSIINNYDYNFYKLRDTRSNKFTFTTKSLKNLPTDEEIKQIIFEDLNMKGEVRKFEKHKDGGFKILRYIPHGVYVDFELKRPTKNGFVLSIGQAVSIN